MSSSQSSSTSGRRGSGLGRGKIQTSSEGESLFEAYHSVFSFITSTEDLYRDLSTLCGSGFVPNGNLNKIKKGNSIIFCKNISETHYKYFHAPTKTIYDPYEHFQLYNSHGNCFAYALYLSSRFNGLNIFPHDLVDVSPFIKKIPYGKKNNTYTIVKNEFEKQAYQSFVNNDYLIINMMLDIIDSNRGIYDKYKKEWDTLDDENKDYYGISQGYSFDSYFKDFKKIAKNIDNVHYMTWDQIINWDKNAHYLSDHENSGIPNAGNPGHLQEFDYR